MGDTILGSRRNYFLIRRVADPTVRWAVEGNGTIRSYTDGIVITLADVLAGGPIELDEAGAR